MKMVAHGIALFCILALLPISSHAQTIAYDHLGGAKYCDVLLSTHPTGAPIGAFADTFGDFAPCLDRLVSSGRVDTARIHLEWSDTHTFRPRDFDAIANKATAYQRILARHPGKRIYLSGACEHNLNSGDAKLLRAKVLAKCPSCAGYVNTPWKGALIDGINEVHGKASPPNGEYFYSFDGHPAVDSDVESYKRRHARAKFFFLWEPRFNGRWEDNDNTPRPQRRGYPDAKLVSSVVALSQAKGATGRLGRLDLHKSHSENKGKGDWRAEHPVDILEQKADFVSYVTTNGLEIEKCSGKDAKGERYSPMTTSPWSTKSPGYRYYCRSWGYELADKARRLSGFPLVYLRINKKNIGPVNPAFREGSFR